MSSKLVSVVMPAYNTAPFIKQSIESVLAQTYRDFEIIVVDDGSTDATSMIAGQFGEAIRYFRQPNQGLSAARNTGIRAARGEYISLLDTDDLYEPEFLSTLIQTLEDNIQIDMSYCSARAIDQNNEPLPQIIGRSLSPDQFYAALLRGGFFPPSCLVARSYCYKSEAGLFDETLRRVEDLDLWLKFAQLYRVHGIADPLLRYRIQPQSLSTDPGKVLNHRIDVLKRHYSVMKDRPLPMPLAEALGRSYIAAAVDYLQLHDLDEAYQTILEGFAISPELVVDFGIYYELALGDQPRGYRGDFLTFDLAYNAGTLIGLLNRLFLETGLPQINRNLEKKAYANAYMAFGLLAYGARNFPAARAYFWRALASDLALVGESRFLPTVIKSLFPARVIDKMRAFRKSFWFSHS